MKKRVVILVLSLALIGASVIHLATLNGNFWSKNDVKLSALSRDEQLQYLEEQGVDVPDNYADFIISIIPLIEEDPDRPVAISISNPKLFYLAEEVEDVVNDYMDENKDAYL